MIFRSCKNQRSNDHMPIKISNQQQFQYDHPVTLIKISNSPNSSLNYKAKTNGT